MGKFDRVAVVKLRILHCQAFEMPPSLQDFYLLQEIRVYNSTINNWTGMLLLPTLITQG